MKPSSWQAAARADGSANKENVGAVTPSPFSSRQRPSAAEVSDGPTWGGGWAASPGSASSVVNALALVPPAARAAHGRQKCAPTYPRQRAQLGARERVDTPQACAALTSTWHIGGGAERLHLAELAPLSQPPARVTSCRRARRSRSSETARRRRVPPPRAGPTKPPPPRRRTAGGRPWTSRWRAAWRRVLVRGERSS